ncbi:class I SAM-dependent methyltransferase [Pseudonocardia humida]|uniref:Class I SAM-dependent methyltransferase n=1 Tax=Pseudonocardia humida TaxID=2800819 RepID=A0ABT1ABD8_9PSEU|nr:class I SAM-dependent methyltransferase [Pseudonocardia humida]MCO1660134.1 class I SAM-dependent methyltransferase [Pseudonocardia humida]
MGAAEEFWDGQYRATTRVWSGLPNAVLADVVGPLAPGTALDLGCGEGGDALWLARRGWRVTAVDVAPTALARVAERAAEARVCALVRTEQHDLAATFPDGRYDLVSAQYLQSPLELPRERVLPAAAEAVAPGGLLLVVEHGSAAPWSWSQDARFPTPEELVAAMGLAEGEWEVERAGTPRREATGPAGEKAMVVDVVVAARRARA